LPGGLPLRGQRKQGCAKGIPAGLAPQSDCCVNSPLLILYIPLNRENHVQDKEGDILNIFSNLSHLVQDKEGVNPANPSKS